MVDLPTLWAFLAATDLLLAAVVGIGVASRPSGGIGLWSASLGVRALAGAVFASHAATEPGALAAGGGLLALSLTLQAAALLSFGRRHLPAWVHTAVIAAIAVPLSIIASDPSSSIVFGGLLFAALLGALAALAWSLHRAAGGVARGVLAAAYGAAAVAFFSRGVAAAFVADPGAAFRAPSGLQAATFLAVAAAAIVSSVAFVLLHKERADAQALHLATMDALTGAYNRRTFHDIAEREMARARRAGQPLSLIMIDIDHFRAVNEEHGQRVGDLALQRFAAMLRASLRQEDMVVRYGGEEFVVLLPEVPGPGAVVVAGRVRKALAAEPIDVGHLKLSLTVSAGVAARLDEGPESVDQLIARADEALTIAKRRGRNRVVALSLGRSIAA